MHQLGYKITNLAPIVLSARYGDTNMVGTLQYIPGTTILGMMAARFLKQKKMLSKNACTDKEFNNFFLNGTIRFGNAFISSTDEDGDDYIHFPTPFSVHKEKRGDRLFDLLMMDHAPEEQTKGAGGFCYLDDGNIAFMEVETNLNFHHARDRETGVSKDKMIFNYESIAVAHTFRGTIKGKLDVLNSLVSLCGNSWSGYIGRSRNSQYGKIFFEFTDTIPQPITGHTNQEEDVSLTFLSDTILYNENGFSTTDRAVLERYLGVKIIKAFIRQDDVETFVGVWRLKRPSESCFRAGSCFLLQPANNEDRLRLSGFEKKGIGERTQEGFGQCIVGWQTDEDLQKQILKMPETQKPTTPIPKAAKDILKALIQNSVYKEIALNAILDLNQFNKKTLPGPSLVGKLNTMAAQMDRDQFIESLGKFRRTASEKLKRCRNDSHNLINFLNEKNVSVAVALKNTKLCNLRELCGEAGYNPETDGDFKAKLYRTYMTTFFSAMRKTTIAAQEKTHDDD